MLAILVLVPFGMAILLPLCAKISRDRLGWFALPFPAAIFAYYLTYLPSVIQGETLLVSYSWIDNLGIDFAFRMDGLSLLFALLISGIGTMVVLYSIFYLSKKEHLPNFYVFLMIFMGSMLGIVTSDNLISLYVFWELTSMSSFLLIGFWHDRERSRYGAQKALLVTIAGGFALLVAFIMMGQAAGTYSISQILANYQVIRDSSGYNAICILIMIGAFAKSTQIPFHIWLPSAMEAPTPISCYLHSATMVKAGIFLLARLTPVLGNSPIWNGTIAIVGLCTLLFGSYMALRQTDLKALLAYSTISQLGLIVSLLGVGTEAAIIAAMFHLFNHSSFKGSLFLMTGIVDHETGTRDITILRGLGRVMPFTAAVALIGSLSMAGLPPFSGFLSKELFLSSVVESGGAGLEFFGGFTVVLTVIAVVASLFTFVYSISIFGKVFCGKKLPAGIHAHEAPLGMLIPAILLVLFNVAVAIAPSVFANGLIGPAAFAVSGVAEEVHFAFWHGVNLPLVLTIVIITCGALLYANLDKFKAFIMRYKMRIGAEKFYDKAVPSIYEFGGVVTDFYMRGSLRNYTAMIITVFLLLVTFPLTKYALWGQLSLDNLAPVSWLEVVMVLVAVAGAIAAAKFKHALYAVLAMAGVGAMVSLFFVVFRAPDLALTQLLVEICTTILFLLVLGMLPKEMEPATPTRKVRKRINLLVSVSFGALVGFLSFFAHSNKLFDPISWFYNQNSFALAGGRNVVNVTLVDFRGLDTMGEITVLCIAAVGTLVLINLLPKKQVPCLAEPTPTQPMLRPFVTNNVILLTSLKSVSFIIILVSLYLFWSGHNAPGGGFIAGLMFSGAFILVYLARGRLFRSVVDLNYKVLLPLGLTFACGCGLGGICFGEAFLSHTFGEFHLPFFGEIELATAAIFDFGVFLVVIGTVMSIVTYIGKGQEV